MRRRRWVALLAVLALTAGCGGDPEPKFAPSSSASPTPVPTPSASESASQPPEPLSPEQTAKAWVDAYTAALRTGRLDEVRSLATRNCETCEEFVSGISSIVDSGGTIETKGWNLVAVERDSVRSETGRPVVRGRLVQAGGSTIRSSGAKPFTYDRRVDQAFFEMQRGGGKWHVQLIFFAG